MFDKKPDAKGSAEPAPKGANGNGADPNFIVQIDDVHKSFVMGKEAVPALRGVSLKVRRGEILCLMGPSGSGKTTMLNIVGGLDTASRGHVNVDGQNVIALSEEKLAEMRRNKIGFIFQNFNLLSSFTALENVQVPMVLAGRRSSKKAQQLLASVGLSDRMNHYPSELSGGQQQRVAIARALANDPPLIIGDEMTGDLDTETSYEIMRLLEATNKERGTTIVYVTHDPRMSKFAHRVIQMRDGKLDASDAAGA
ncbi:MAG TPA: ABC transporter ATP-binding protein [Thermoflexales bacterium]|jgi:putative ABC transport system ATP-binding protein|nr:ABC transporter ATP-binding protein [Anaerolineae bacterium]HQV28353.1 ABC transporter ATP-binding protein [Thermoflexales bacterium]HQX11939.1 ABC transporter ATP-binding protein [Thermoflexales bacterium]HQY26414.1 ABC transporter ATP-binding protein [Thermoflexales bacterium]HQZ54661.1 ABC transporter ATP-binding protein [Thermoflexales bacterium]